MNMKMDSSEDPDIFMTAIENLNNKMKAIYASYKKSEKEIKAKILVSLPEKYSEVITTADSNPTMSLKKEYYKILQVED